MIKAREVEKNEVYGQAALFAAAAAGGFVLSGTSITGAASFVSISLAGAASLPYSAAVFAGSLARYIVTGSAAANIVHIVSMIICLIFKLFFDFTMSPKKCGIVTAAAVFTSGAAVAAIIGELTIRLFFYALYGAVSGFTAYCGASVADGIKRRAVIDLSSPVSCAYAVVYTMISASLCSANFDYLNAGIAFGTAVTLIAACNYGYMGGILCGALSSCGAFLCSPSVGVHSVFLPAAGFLTGYFRRRKSGTAAFFFGMFSFLFMAASGVDPKSLPFITGMLLGILIFLAVSPYYSDKWVITGAEDAALNGISGSRMSFLADSIKTLRTEAVRIFDVLSKNSSDVDIAQQVSRSVCHDCHRRPSCWIADRDKTLRGFEKLSRQLGDPHADLPYELEECLKGGAVVKGFEEAVRERTAARMLELRLTENQRMLSEQIRVTEEIVAAASERADVRHSEPISRLISLKLSKFGFEAKRVIAYYNSHDRLNIELYFDKENAPAGSMRISDLIADELHISMEFSEPLSTSDEVRMRIYERPKYCIEAYGASICAENSKETGDSTAVFSDGTGGSYVILSDGMGTGRQAALGSRMVVSMFKRLIGSGVNCISAIRLINSIMLAKSSDETFATLDAVRIDLDTCGLTIMKSGASATLIRHGGQVMKVTSPTFPIGIIESAEAFSREYELEEGDMIVMFSDGISEGEYQFIKELLMQGSNVKYIVDEICAKAELFNKSAHTDDVTVIGIKVERSEI